MELRGTEAVTIEAHGSLAAASARELIGGAPLELEARADGRAAVSLLFFQMRGLAPWGAPAVGLDYHEALFRLGVLYRGTSSWLVVRCDVDHALVRATGARLLRYPMRPARFMLAIADVWAARVEAGDPRRALRAEARPSTESPPANTPRPALVRSDGGLYRVPWEEVAAPYRRVAALEVSGDLDGVTFGESPRWDATGLVHRGRGHRCRLAERVT